MSIASLLLTPSQFLIFEREGKHLEVEEANKHQVLGDPFYGLQPDMLTGSSTSKQGVIMLPGVIDADFTGQVQIMAYARQPPVTIPAGSKIAQIVAFENLLALVNVHENQLNCKDKTKALDQLVMMFSSL
ncbi:hypothetical protein HGM15179_021018 [Zosterops borbonicus]|uniref:dUTPase-like domain-containing protein n=1 Tax=Zosterops borbonicus TaxID=364589 RepID=A0A8K1D998_9PASS|nr:hypothetical protein HGM15179_021018 [Zosterops borbonicus]